MVRANGRAVVGTVALVCWREARVAQMQHGAPVPATAIWSIRDCHEPLPARDNQRCCRAGIRS